MDRHATFARELGSLTNDQRRTFRINIYEETIRVARAGEYSLPTGEVIQLDARRLLTNTQEYLQIRSPEELKLREFTPEETRVIVFQGDCLEAALHMKQLGFNVVVLNMASAFKPGGGVRDGAGAQEENLFRRSNYFQHLVRPAIKYPLSATGGVYTPKVTVFRQAEASRYEFMREPLDLAFIAVAAIRRPNLVRSMTYSREDEQLMKQKIRAIYSLAANGDHDCLILSAFGCGAYMNPPSEVARLFHEVLEEEAYRLRFRRVVFAIFNDHNAMKSHNSKGNVVPFAEEFRCDITERLESLA
eukprot:CAMPEP_0204917258 /NCGR_PEP_ID=MMETSP1397-20131031/14883_1 /ASSEMBLY_ACC=CAM_ASM_000891 /TAXON_ID=49980 /ORGANISM="Climacostomum Climacostomum virens, Strain Stock W-24" /LENGTH=301 /DNA_ID=CAMNT_0052090049 /DNA_START=34 /DNA_END=939 /DNA_ORIENTATION=+